MSWIDFKALRQELNFAQVLQHYGVEHKVKGDRASAFCPLPGHRGKRRSPSFSADLKRGLWQCFGCGEKGNVIEFAALMEKLDPQNPREFHKTAALLQERFLGNRRSRDPLPNGAKGRSNGRPNRRATERRDSAPMPNRKPPPPQSQAKLPVLVNPALDFELKNLDAEHQYLKERGFLPETIEHFGLGFCNRGSLKDRIAIPLHDMAGKLVGYAGRVSDDTVVSAENSKYLFPSERERNGQLLQFRKSLFLYNGYRIAKPVKDLVVVEGFPATWWLWQHGVRNTVALMGSSCSKEQGELIVKLVEPYGSVWVFTDGDDAGRRCAASVFLFVGAERFCRLVRMEEGEQPTDWTGEDLFGAFGAEKCGESDDPDGASLCGDSTDKVEEPTAAEG